MSRYMIKIIYLDLPKRLIIWNGGSIGKEKINEKGRQKIKERRQTCYMGPISCSGLTFFVENDEKKRKKSFFAFHNFEPNMLFFPIP